MKFQIVLLIVALLVSLCSLTTANVQHSEPSVGQIDYCVMCNETALCASGTGHKCTMVNLGQCTYATKLCNNVTTNYFIKATQNDETVTISMFDNDSKCETQVGSSTQVTCDSCAQDGTIEVLCAKSTDSSSTSNSNSIVIQSTFSLLLLFVTLIFITL